MALLERIYKLRGVVQHYSWGGYDFIPGLLQLERKEEKPYAEYWLGAHPKSPSTIEGKETSLSDLIQNHSTEVLGRAIAEKYSSLPFLLKVLDVRKMLSIQVHPNRSSAEVGFKSEDEKGLSIDAPNRNYKDCNHKPEMMVALSDFWLLHGFKEEGELVSALEGTPEFDIFIRVFYEMGYEGLLRHVMNMPQDDVDTILSSLMQRIVPLYKSGELSKSQEHFWAARAAEDFCSEGHFDRGIFLMYFLNLVHLTEGEGIFQPVGILHAYLEGQNIEVMASSDNVLRAGLTDKHVDTAEVLKCIEFVATTPEILKPGKEQNKIYEVPADEFALQQLLVDSSYGHKTENAEILFVMNGQLTAYSENSEVNLKKGEAALIAAGSEIILNPDTASKLFRVFTP